jgi:membrane-associated protease RseP (regulator of RpoE activity)
MGTLVLFLGVLLNFALYIMGAALGGWHSLQTMAALAVLNFVAILFHELGHAWAFRHVGGSVQKIVVLFLSYNVGKRRFGRSRLSRNGDVGGYVAGRFRPEGPTIRDQIIVSGAGPVANMVTGAIAGVVSWAWTAPDPVDFFGDPEVATAGPPDMAALAPVVTGQPNMADPMGLPSSDMVSMRMDDALAFADAMWWFDQGHTTLILFATLSLGVALLNLIPYGGSDGQKIAHALRMRRAVRSR